MDNELLRHYSEELAYLATLFDEFAKAHPDIARELRIHSHHTDDPHVSRLIQSFALISAKTKQRLTDNFSELSHTLLDLLYPHYLTPFPSCAVIAFQPEKDLRTLKTIPIGSSIDVHGKQNDTVCRFRTVYDTELLPIVLTDAHLSTHFKETEQPFGHMLGQSCLKLVLETQDPTLFFNQLDCKTLRFFIKAPKVSAYKLYDLLFCHALQLHGYADNKQLFTLPASLALKPVGFEKSEGLLPYPEQSSFGYALLTEFFAFPEKFLFFDVCLTDSLLTTVTYNTLTIYVAFDYRDLLLEGYVNKEYFSLNCTPIVNLFVKKAEPIVWDHTVSEYPVIADLDDHKKMEVYALLDVTLIDKSDGRHRCKPFYGVNHARNNCQYYWKMHRRISALNSHDYIIYLSLVDTQLGKTSSVNGVITIELLSTNGNVPAQLATSGNKLHLQFHESSVPVAAIHVITPFTPKKQWDLTNDTHWRLIAHLNLNHLSLYDTQADSDVLREILHLYDFIDDEGTQQLIQSIKVIAHEPVLLRDPSGVLNAFIQGLKLTVMMDRKAMGSHSVFLFGSILNHFFSLHCGLNSFTQLTICDEQHKVRHTWQARSGSKAIL